MLSIMMFTEQQLKGQDVAGKTLRDTRPERQTPLGIRRRPLRFRRLSTLAGVKNFRFRRRAVLSRLANVSEPLGRDRALQYRYFARLLENGYDGVVGFRGAHRDAPFRQLARLIVASGRDAGAQQAAELFELLRHFG